MLAKYIRLSDQDEDLGSLAKMESNSVVNQRALLDGYLATSTEFSGLPALEFLDDGRSGTNFDRPGVRALLAAAQRGEVDCVIVKDFSRFGRTHLEVGRYLEQVFPFLGIRFISVNENYDSKRQVHGTAGDLDTSLRNLINELYSRDLSEKVISAKRQYAKRGQYINAYPFFGYVKSKEDKRKLVLDPPAAAVVRRVFELHLSGMGATQIALALNQEDVKTPTARKRELGAKRKSWNSDREKNEWSGTTVLRILRDERYTGKLIGCRTSRKELGKPGNTALAPEAWIVVPDAFEGIVSQEDFDAAQLENRRTPRPSTQPKSRPLFYRKLQCAVCGLAPERIKGQRPYYRCKMTAWNAGDGCGEVRIYEDDLIRVVLHSIRHCAQLAVQTTENRVLLEESFAQTEQRITTRLAVLKSRKKGAFLRLHADEISKDKYQQEIADYKAQEHACHEELNAAYAKQGAAPTQQEQTAMWTQYANLDALDAGMVDKLVRRIRIAGGGKIEIVWNFKDPAQEWMETK